MSVIIGKDRKLINEVVDQFADYTATDLVNFTHNQAPWKMLISVIRIMR